MKLRRTALIGIAPLSKFDKAQTSILLSGSPLDLESIRFVTAIARCYTPRMETGTPSKTAFRVALRRAVHQVLDPPPVLADPIAIPLLGSHFQFDHTHEMNPIARAFRAFMAMRSRYAEDRLAESVANGVQQYVLLGAGLDTFAYRNPHAMLRVFEVDFPATQQWKRTLLSQAAIRVPESLTFAALDFEHHTLAEGLAEAGFDFRKPAFFGWLGVVPYLTREAFRHAGNDREAA